VQTKRLRRYVSFLNPQLSEISPAALAYRSTKVTKDIDMLGDRNAIEEAYQAAVKQTGLEIEIDQVGIADFPYNMEERLIKYDKVEFTHLTVGLPDPYDLVLMKTMRAQQGDLEVIQEICKSQNLGIENLIERYNDEMTHVIGDKKQLRHNFLGVLEVGFGEDQRKKFEDKVKLHR